MKQDEIEKTADLIAQAMVLIEAAIDRLHDAHALTAGDANLQDWRMGVMAAGRGLERFVSDHCEVFGTREEILLRLTLFSSQ